MSSKKQRIIKYDTIVVGDTIEALVYAFINQAPCITDNSLLFDRDIDKLDPSIDLVPILLPHPTTQIRTVKGIETRGISMLDLQNYLKFCLSMDGYLPFNGTIRSIRINDDNSLTVRNGDSGKHILKYKKLEIFTPGQVHGLEIETYKEPIYRIVHNFKFAHLLAWDYDVIRTDEPFLREVYQLSKTKGKGVSFLTKKERESHDFSDFFVKRKLKEVLKEMGATSPPRNWTKRYILDRTVTKINRNTYIMPNKVNLNTLTLKEILCLQKTWSVSYQWKIQMRYSVCHGPTLFK
jgi:hypothetical protein